MKKYVLDASFLLAVLLKEGKIAPTTFKKISSQVEKKQARLFSLPLVLWELANALRFKLPVSSEAVVLYQRFKNLPIEILPLASDQLESIILAAYETRTTVYDASYHFLAKTLGGTFLTCDKEYFQKAKELGGIEFVGESDNFLRKL